MTSRDDALTWDGDDDPTPEVGDTPPALPEGYTAVGKGSETVGRIEPDGTVTMPADPAPMGNAALVGLGVLGGVYLLFTVGWVVGGLRLGGVAQFLVSPTIYNVALWLAVLAAPIWFGVTFLLTRESKTWVRIVWLLAGAVLLVPWPFAMVGAVGQ
ncbi:MAG: DNA polymerase III subunit gamma/tau [Microbacterium sp.]|uniref:DNA polymerase III subunit gamma/tau n=1 Tax=Microbacterium sp. TaxID=51671 RepID=UPI003A86E1E0